MEFLNWVGDHPILTVVLLLIFIIGACDLIAVLKMKRK